MSTMITAERRTHTTRSGMKNLRGSGRLPAIVFGRNIPSEMIHIPTGDFERWMKQGASGFIELKLSESESLNVLLEDFQRHPSTQEFLHVDFQQVQKNESVRTKVPVEFFGTPVGTKTGGVVQVQSAFIEVEALPRHLPATFTVDISEMEIADAIQVKDVQIPEDVTLISGENECLVSVVKP